MVLTHSENQIKSFTFHLQIYWLYRLIILLSRAKISNYNFVHIFPVFVLSSRFTVCKFHWPYIPQNIYTCIFVGNLCWHNLATVGFLEHWLFSIFALFVLPPTVDIIHRLWATKLNYTWPLPSKVSQTDLSILFWISFAGLNWHCLLYTSDAADE